MPPTKHNGENCPFKDVVFPVDREPEDRKMDTRVGRLEGVVESLTRDIQEVSQNISMMGKELGSFRELIGDALTRMRDGFNTQLNTVTDRMMISTKPQWQTITAFSVMGLTVLGMAGAVVALLLSGQSDNISSLKKDTATITERMFQNQYEKGKSDAFAQTTERELNALLRTLDDKVKALDDKIATENKMRDKETSAELTRLTTEIIDLRKWRLEHATEGAGVDARVAARQEMIAEFVKTLEARMHSHEQLDRVQESQTHK